MLKISLEKGQLSNVSELSVRIKRKSTSELKKMSYLQLANDLYPRYLIFLSRPPAR